MKSSRKKVKTNAIIIAVLAIILLLGASFLLVRDIKSTPESEEGGNALVVRDIHQEEPQEEIDPGYICSSDFYGCLDFDTQAEAQRVLEYCGGIGNDIHTLDPDHDGIACDALL